MSKLSDYTYRACAEACSAAKHGRDSSTESHMSPVRPARLPLGPARRMPDHAPPARKAARAATSATPPDDASSVPTPTFLPAQMSPLPLGPVHHAPDHFSESGHIDVNRATELQLMTPPLIPLPGMINRPDRPGSRSLHRFLWPTHSRFCPGRGCSTLRPHPQLRGITR